MTFPSGDGFLENIGARIVFTPNQVVSAAELSWWLMWCLSVERKLS